MSSPAPLNVVADALRQRRTVNFFTDQAVDESLIREAVRVARWAPNHRLTEPWRFFHLGPESRRAVIDLAVRPIAEARGEAAARARRERLEAVPQWLVLTCSIAEDPLVAQEDYAATACAAQNMLLYLSTAGLGCKWTTGPVTRDPELLRLLNLQPEAHRVVGLFWIGHPAQAPESRRAPVAEVYQRLP